MNGTITPTTGRSVQLAVMSAPTTSVLEAASEARRRTDEDDGQERATVRTIFVTGSASA